MTTFIAIAITLLAAYIGFKILKFVASMVIKAVLFFLIVGAAAYLAFKYIVLA
jgi:hypothetical protein